MNGLEAQAQKLLQKDPGNPNRPEPTARPGLGLSKSTMGGAKSSVREAVLAQKKAAMATRNVPARPGSAMAHFSPARTVSNSSNSSTSTTNSGAATTGRSRPESTIAVKPGGMSVAPMRPTKKRPELAARPATAGPYSVRGHDAPTEAPSPDMHKPKFATPKPIETSPRRTAPRTRPPHATHASESNLPSPSHNKRTGASPKVSPARLRQSQMALPGSSPSKANEELTLVVPNLANLRQSPSSPNFPKSPKSPLVVPKQEPAQEDIQEESEVDEIPKTIVPIESDTPIGTPQKIKVFEDPFTDEQATPKPASNPPVLEDRPVNEDAAKLAKRTADDSNVSVLSVSPEKTRQNTKLLESGVTRINAKTLDVHGFRKLQSLIRENKAFFTDDKFDAMVQGLFKYLEDPLSTLVPDKVQDVKAQILATLKLLLKKERENFQPHVSAGLESLVATRSTYNTRARIVSGMELLAGDLITLGDAAEIAVTMSKRLQQSDDSSTEGCRVLQMGLHILKELIDARADFTPADKELSLLVSLSARSLESADSGVRMEAVQLCVAMHARLGETVFWDALKGVREDPKSLITYYVVKRQREATAA